MDVVLNTVGKPYRDSEQNDSYFLKEQSGCGEKVQRKESQRLVDKSSGLVQTRDKNGSA